MTASQQSRRSSPGRDGGGVHDLTQLRVLLVHEWLYTWAGAERCLEQLVAMIPQAHVLVGVITPEMRRANAIAARAEESWVGKLPAARSHHRWFLPLHALAFRMFDTSGYDLVISLSHAFEKSIRRPRAGVPHVCYCFSPPRYLWDLREAHGERASLPQRLALAAGLPLLRALDRRGAAGVDRFVSISHHVADRVRRTYGRDSAVVYPPVVPKQSAATAARSEPFLLSIGRLVEYKRVDLAIQAAERLRIKLVVAGDGPDRTRLERMAGPFTEFVGRVSEDGAARLLDSCAAFVFCAEEEFGIAPVEANAHGKPVVGYARGGLRETMVDGETAVLFERQDADSVARAVQACLARTWDTAALRRNAERFSPAAFQAGMTGEIGAALTTEPGAASSLAPRR